MLVIGEVPADYAPVDPADQTQRILRCYEITTGDSLPAMGMITSATSAFFLFKPVGVKGGTPTITLGPPAGFNVNQPNGVNAVASAVSASPPTTSNSIHITLTSTGLTPYWPCFLYAPSSTVTVEWNP